MLYTVFVLYVAPRFLPSLVAPIFLQGIRWKKNKDKPVNSLQCKGFSICPYYAIRAHLRNDSPAKRRGCQNCFINARPLRRGIHAPYLHPRYPTSPRRSGGENGRVHGASHVASYPILSTSFQPFPRVGHGVGQRKRTTPEKFRKHAKTPRNCKISGCFWSW